MAETGDIEIAVEAASEEAIQGINETEQALEDAGDTMADTAEEMGGLMDQMQGLGGAIAAGLAVTAGAVLSKVPVLGEAFAGLTAVFDAIAFQLDGFLRKIGAGGLGGALFDLSNWIYGLNGAAGDLAGIIGTLITLAGSAGATFLAYTAKVNGLAAAYSSLVSGITTITSGFTSLISTITSLIAGSTALAGAVGALLGVFTVGILEVTGFMDAVRNLGAWIGDRIPNAVRDLIVLLTIPLTGALTTIGAAISGFVDGFLDGGLGEGIDRAISNVRDMMDIYTRAFNNLAGGVATGLQNAADDVIRWTNFAVVEMIDALEGLGDAGLEAGRSLIDGLVEGIRGGIDRVRDAVGSVADAAGEYMPSSPAEKGELSNLDEYGPAFVETVAGGIEANTGRMGEAADAAAGEAASGQGGVFSADRGGGAPIIEMDGRRLTHQDSRYRRDETASRGRNG